MVFSEIVDGFHTLGVDFIGSERACARAHGGCTVRVCVSGAGRGEGRGAVAVCGGCWDTHRGAVCECAGAVGTAVHTAVPLRTTRAKRERNDTRCAAQEEEDDDE